MKFSLKQSKSSNRKSSSNSYSSALSFTSGDEIIATQGKDPQGYQTQLAPKPLKMAPQKVYRNISNTSTGSNQPVMLMTPPLLSKNSIKKELDSHQAQFAGFDGSFDEPTNAPQLGQLPIQQQSFHADHSTSPTRQNSTVSHGSHSSLFSYGDEEAFQISPSRTAHNESRRIVSDEWTISSGSEIDFVNGDLTGKIETPDKSFEIIGSNSVQQKLSSDGNFIDMSTIDTDEDDQLLEENQHHNAVATDQPATQSAFDDILDSYSGGNGDLADIIQEGWLSYVTESPAIEEHDSNITPGDNSPQIKQQHTIVANDLSPETNSQVTPTRLTFQNVPVSSQSSAVSTTLPPPPDSSFETKLFHPKPQRVMQTDGEDVEEKLMSAYISGQVSRAASQNFSAAEQVANNATQYSVHDATQFSNNQAALTTLPSDANANFSQISHVHGSSPASIDEMKSIEPPRKAVLHDSRESRGNVSVPFAASPPSIVPTSPYAILSPSSAKNRSPNHSPEISSPLSRSPEQVQIPPSDRGRTNANRPLSTIRPHSNSMSPGRKLSPTRMSPNALSNRMSKMSVNTLAKNSRRASMPMPLTNFPSRPAELILPPLLSKKAQQTQSNQIQRQHHRRSQLPPPPTWTAPTMTSGPAMSMSHSTTEPSLSNYLRSNLSSEEQLLSHQQPPSPLNDFHNPLEYPRRASYIDNEVYDSDSDRATLESDDGDSLRREFIESTGPLALEPTKRMRGKRKEATNKVKKIFGLNKTISDSESDADEEQYVQVSEDSNLAFVNYDPSKPRLANGQFATNASNLIEELDMRKKNMHDRKIGLNNAGRSLTPSSESIFRLDRAAEMSLLQLNKVADMDYRTQVNSRKHMTLGSRDMAHQMHHEAIRDDGCETLAERRARLRSSRDNLRDQGETLAERRRRLQAQSKTNLLSSSASSVSNSALESQAAEAQ